jgi:small nuclear ribonucleoprotein E
MIPPINLLFKFLQQHTTVQIWLFEQVDSRLEGKIRGFDEFMNLVVDEAVEINLKKGTKRPLGRILLKGDNITLVSSLEG